MKEKLLNLGLTEEQTEAVIQLMESKNERESENGNGNEKANEEIERLKKEVWSYEEQIKELQAREIIDDELRKAGAKNVKAARGLIDMNKLEFDGESVKGLEEQIKELVNGEDTSFLFAKKSGTGLKGVKPAYSSGKTGKKDFKDYSYDDWDEYFKRNN